MTLSNRIHFGDELLSINDYLIGDRDSFLLLAKNSIRPIINIKVKRLPHARALFISDIIESSPEELVLAQPHADVLQAVFGIKLKQNTSKIEKIYEDGLFFKNGLKYDSNKVEYEITANVKHDERERLTKWVITEINGEFINYKCSAEEVR